MSRIAYNHAAVAQLGSDVIAASAQLQDVRSQFTQQRGRLDPEFSGAGAQTYFDRQVMSEQGLAELADGLHRLGQAVQRALDGAIATDLAGQSMFS
ncbi:hypothetical protein C0J29_31810 (plasmid) [Mycobacterium paragordonae]|uniref:WXG100 family type VII secretion target n=1 Tax=Mycobacterium paragordonae TaxID=1389713 RepID=A0ABQ1CGA2_9MYCO|nr:WXG100 family type VII secretion target [Mycobacterium paragordonae]AYE99551.1 hypothetical protein C0J29_31810 [Mycobacterium paragordonae]GFG83232.1 hypothetical protein MPRG_65080 [Mycobacterium paragordonae]